MGATNAPKPTPVPIQKPIEAPKMEQKDVLNTIAPTQEAPIQSVQAPIETPIVESA
jgi:hypothetical protein